MAETPFSGRLYNIGNDYPADVCKRDATLDGTTWISGTYLDGIYTSAAKGFVTGGWNVYFSATLPQDNWTSIVENSAAVFPPEYATASLVFESAHQVSAYAQTSGYENLVGKVINEYNIYVSADKSST